ncbi:MAG TPA: histidine kinase dimerization/phospho-acceptor domain-containing protein, partial [Anaerolineaceae bacterium]|nr:histidine kinase dimerization/phospho-acceptor domain-containing protein [Anaerolineaceae bacterium]
MMRNNYPHKRPRWWPEEEAWPPAAPAARGRFFRRVGCMFVLLNFLVLALISAVAGMVAHFAGALQPPSTFRWVVPVGVFLTLTGMGVLFLVARRLRGMSRPFQSLFDASERVAAGDFSARAEEERGFPEVRSLARAFNEMAARLQVTDEQRRTMLAEITHELRTPLTVIQGNIEGMLDDVYPRDEAHLRAILEETQLLTRLVDDLRTLALAESGALQLHKEAVDFGVLVGATVAAFKPQAEAVKVELRIASISNNENLIINLDPERMRQVLVNLLTNALRYAGRVEQGGLVEVRMGRQGATAWLE